MPILATFRPTTPHHRPVEIRNFGRPDEEVLTYPRPHIRVRNGAEVHYLHHDHLGSVATITDSAGAVVEDRHYAPFGEIAAATGGTTPVETIGFIGECYDGDAGLQYLNARYYDPRLGLFIQPDWFEVTEPGVGTNRYAYSGNDPVNLLDPSGNSWISRVAEEIADQLRGSARRGVDEASDGVDDAVVRSLASGMRQLHRQAVGEAWWQEMELVRRTGRGTAEWSERQLRQLAQGIRPRGIHGHHINNVAHHPDLAGDPNNIMFMRGPQHTALHSTNGGTRMPTTGEFIDRAVEFENFTGEAMGSSGRMMRSYDDVLNAARESGRSMLGRTVDGISNTLNALPPDPLGLGIDYVTGQWQLNQHLAYCQSNPDRCS